MLTQWKLKVVLSTKISRQNINKTFFPLAKAFPSSFTVKALQRRKMKKRPLQPFFNIFDIHIYGEFYTKNYMYIYIYKICMKYVNNEIYI